MALQSSRKGLRKEFVDYLGNLIINNKLKRDIVNSIDDTFANKNDVLSLEEIEASSDLTGKIASASALKTVNGSFEKIISAYNWNTWYTSNIDTSNKKFLIVLANLKANNFIFTNQIFSVDLLKAFSSGPEKYFTSSSDSGINLYINGNTVGFYADEEHSNLFGSYTVYIL